jgi:superfamily II DNA/RNA helicase
MTNTIEEYEEKLRNRNKYNPKTGAIHGEKTYEGRNRNALN